MWVFCESAVTGRGGETSIYYLQMFPLLAVAAAISVLDAFLVKVKFSMHPVKSCLSLSGSANCNQTESSAALLVFDGAGLGLFFYKVCFHV